MENKRKRYLCIKSLLMCDGSWGFIKGKSYLGFIFDSGGGSFISEVGTKHGIPNLYVNEYLYQFKYGK